MNCPRCTHAWSAHIPTIDGWQCRRCKCKRLHPPPGQWPSRAALTAMNADEIDAFLASIGRPDLKVARDRLR